MRLLLVGISGLALTACSMNGYEYGHAQGPSYGVHPGQSACQLDPCQAGFQPPVQQPYGAQFGHGQYVTGHVAPQPVTHWTPPAPQAPCDVQHYQPAPVLHPSPCSAGAYSVASHGPDMGYGPVDYGHAGYGHGGYQQGGHSQAYIGPAAPYGKRPAYKYGELGYVNSGLFDTNTDDREGIGSGIVGRLGWRSASWYGVEAEGLVGLSKGETAPGVETGVNYQVAGFGVARLPLGRSDRARLLARAGYHVAELETETALATTDRSEDGVAFGIGFEYDVTPRSSIRFDSTAYSAGTDEAISNLSATYQFRF